MFLTDRKLHLFRHVSHLIDSEAHSEPSQICKMERFSKVVIGFKLLIMLIIVKTWQNRHSKASVNEELS